MSEAQGRSRTARLREGAAAWLAHPWLPLHLALVAVALCLPALGGGWQSDDFFHRVVLRGEVETGYSQLELFSVMRFGPEVRQAYVDLGLFPWWTAEGFRLAFCRHLSAATHWLDYRLWPDSAVLQHAHSLLWLGALVAAATLLYRRIHGATAVAGLAALLYAVDDAHGAPAGWIANRNALVATFFGLLCLLAHDRWRRGGGAAAGAMAALSLALALAAGELGLGALAYLVAYAAFVDRGRPRQRLASLIPYGAVFLGWAALYRALGFGAAGSGLYVDPGGEPLEFARRLVERAPFYLTGQLTPLQAELWIFDPANEGGVRWLMVAAFAVMVAVLGPLVARDRAARFWALGAVLAVVPLCATFPSNRVLFFVGLGGMGLVAQWLTGAWRRGVGVRRWLRRLVAVALVATHLVLAPLLLPFAVRAFEQFGEPAKAAILSLPDGLVGQELVVVNAPDYLSYVSQAGSVLLLHGRPAPRIIRGLAIGPSAAVAHRVDERTLDLTMARGFLGGALGTLFHDSLAPFAEGASFGVPGMTATVLARAPGGRPATVRFRFDTPLESAARRWVQFRDGRFVTFTPPPVGDPVELPPALGPLELAAGRLVARRPQSPASSTVAPPQAPLAGSSASIASHGCSAGSSTESRARAAPLSSPGMVAARTR